MCPEEDQCQCSANQKLATNLYSVCTPEWTKLTMLLVYTDMYNASLYSRVQLRFQNITCPAWQAAPKVYLPCRHFHLPHHFVQQRWSSYNARTLPKTLLAERGKLGFCSACPIFFCRIHSQLAKGQVFMLHPIVLASKASGHHFGCPNPWITPIGTPNFLWGIYQNAHLKFIIKFVHLQIIPMTLYTDSMPYFRKSIHVYGWNLSILWVVLSTP